MLQHSSESQVSDRFFVMADSVLNGPRSSPHPWVNSSPPNSKLWLSQLIDSQMQPHYNEDKHFIDYTIKSLI